MQEIRCPDCGYRLKTNECPICCKRVPFPVAARQKTAQQKPKHPRNIEISFPKSRTVRRKQNTKPAKPKLITAILAVVMVVFPLLAELVDRVGIAAPEPVYPERFAEEYYAEAFYAASYYDDYLEAGLPGAEHVRPMEPRTVYEGHGIVIAAESFGLLYDDPAVLVTISNTSDRNITVSTDSIAVNGYMMNTSGLFYETQAGETVQTHLRLYEEDLKAAGIETVANVRLRLDLYDGDDYSDIDPNVWIELETSAADTVQPVDDSGMVVYDADGVRLIFKGIQMDDYGDATVCFFAENLTEHPVNIGSAAVYLNGEETDGMLWCHLWPDTRSVDSIYLFEISEYGIAEDTDIREIMLELYIENAENWETVSETVKIAFAE